jgi:tetratricopeptide (TPR) repeat protein
MGASEERQGPNRRLETWKEIGAFLSRDARTVRRWEAERGLPVRRVPGAKSKVYAYANDLTEWLAGPQAAALDEAQPAEAPPDGAGLLRHPAMLAAALLVLAALVIGLVVWPRSEGRAPGAATAAAASRHTPDPEAERLYLSGMSYWNTRTPDGLQKALDSFTQAVVKDPQYAQAYVGLANCYNLLREYTLMRPEEAYPRARAAAERAVALDDGLSEAHSALAFAAFFGQWDARTARREFDRAIALDPRSSVAHHWRATFLYHLGEFDAALASIETAQKLSPESASVLADRAAILAQLNRTGEAISILDDLERSQPSFLSSHTYLAQIYEQKGDWPKYVTELEHGAALKRDPPAMAVARAARAGLSRPGPDGMLKAVLAEQLKLNAQGRLPPLALARTYALLGDRAKAIELLRRSVAEHDPNVVAVGIEPPFWPLHAEPEFRRVMAPVGVLGPATDRTAAAGLKATAAAKGR